MPDPEKIIRLLDNRAVQMLLRRLTRRRPDGRSTLDDFFRVYASNRRSLGERLRFAVPNAITEFIRRRTGASRETLAAKVFGHPPTARALVNTARSVGHFGLTLPQKFVAPLMVVWNFTQACNFKCQHCYQNAHQALPDELSLDEKIAVVDKLAALDVSMLAFSGGEPLMGKNFWEVARHAGEVGFHMSVATNGSLLNAETVQRLVDCKIGYAEISLDSLDPAKHDTFRGGQGYWAAAVRGLDACLANPKMKVGVATTVTRMNLDELEAIIQWAIDRGVNTFYAFNFIPTGRGRNMVDADLSPHERERMLQILQKTLTEDKIAVMSSATQYGRACLELGADDGRINTGHYGYSSGKKTRLLARYVGGCGAGRCYCAIQPDGKVTPCVFLPLTIADLRTDDFQQVWLNHPLLKVLRDRQDRSGHCKICDYKYYCGGCRARSWGYFQDVRRSDPGCKFNQAEWAEVLRAAEGEKPPG
jgi:radical SAM protein with 4Fe4S-binding SPASM domain